MVSEGVEPQESSGHNPATLGGHIRVIFGLFWSYIGIMENKMESSITDSRGFRVQGLSVRV